LYSFVSASVKTKSSFLIEVLLGEAWELVEDVALVVEGFTVGLLPGVAEEFWVAGAGAGVGEVLLLLGTGVGEVLLGVEAGVGEVLLVGVGVEELLVVGVDEEYLMVAVFAVPFEVVVVVELEVDPLSNKAIVWSGILSNNRKFNQN
jgi:hypothetical protein